MPTRFLTYNAPGSHVYAAPAYGQPARPLIIVNRDSTNPIYYAPHPGMLNTEASTIDPQTYVAFDGQEDIWMSTLNSAISVLIDIKFGAIAMGNVT